MPLTFSCEVGFDPQYRRGRHGVMPSIFVLSPTEMHLHQLPPTRPPYPVLEDFLCPDEVFPAAG